jgi:hypothetical protein
VHNPAQDMSQGQARNEGSCVLQHCSGQGSRKVIVKLSTGALSSHRNRAMRHGNSIPGTNKKSSVNLPWLHVCCRCPPPARCWDGTHTQTHTCAWGPEHALCLYKYTQSTDMCQPDSAAPLQLLCSLCSPPASHSNIHHHHWLRQLLHDLHLHAAAPIAPEAVHAAIMYNRN